MINILFKSFKIFVFVFSVFCATSAIGQQGKLKLGGELYKLRESSIFTGGFAVGGELQTKKHFALTVNSGVGRLDRATDHVFIPVLAGLKIYTGYFENGMYLGVEGGALIFKSTEQNHFARRSIDNVSVLRISLGRTINDKVDLGFSYSFLQNNIGDTGLLTFKLVFIII